MPNKTIYVTDADLPVFEKAQALAGGNLSAAIAQAIHRYVADAPPEPGIVTVVVSEGSNTAQKRFEGQFLAQHKVLTPDGTRAVTYRVYRTAKGRYAVWSRTAPNWNRGNWSDWALGADGHGGWPGGWWRADARLDVFDALDDLRDALPPDLFARVSGEAPPSDIEVLDI